MGDDEYRLVEAVNRIKNRVKKIVRLKARFDSEIGVLIAEARTDVRSLQLQLDANRVAAASVATGHRKK